MLRLRAIGTSLIEIGDSRITPESGVLFALLLYLIASGVLAYSFADGRKSGPPRTGTAAAVTGVLLHGVALGAFTAAHGELPLVGLGPSLATLGFLIGIFLLVTNITSARPVGLVLIPVIAVLAALALLLGLQPAGEDLAFRGVWFAFHVLAAFIGYAGLTVAFAAGLLYLLQFRELKAKRLGRVFRFFPALPTLDLLGRWSVAIGFPALTLALLLGWGWTVRFRDTLAFANPQVIWGVITWLA